jgi:hypothetical protein
MLTSMWMQLLVILYLLVALLILVCFSWVRWEANVVAHTLAKHVPSPNVPNFICNFLSLARFVWTVWRNDCVYCFLS